MKAKIKIVFQIILITSLLSCNTVKKENSTKNKLSIAKAISILPDATIKETIAYYHKLKKEQSDVYNFDDENELNALGYQYINNGKAKDAIEIFKLLVSEFPNSSNAFDSLGEAYETDDNNELAIINFKKALVLDPTNPNSERGLFRVNYKTRERPKFDQVFTRKQYLEDIDELAKRLVETHPTPFEFTTKETFYSLVNSQKEKVKENMIFGQFIWLLSPIIASIGCEHTQFDQFWIENKMLPIDLRFSIEAELVGTKLLVTNTHHNKEVPLGSSIKSINGVPIAKIIDNVFSHISTNGYTKSLKRAILNRFITSYVPYYLGFPKTYSITLEEDNNAITLSPLKKFEIVSPKKIKALNFEILAEDTIAKLTIKSFNFFGGKRLRDYKSFIDSSFIEINKKGIKNLVIDIRGNGGGCSCGAIYLLQHISKKPFTYFSPDLPILPGDKSENQEKALAENRFLGDTYILTDGFNTSTSGHLLAMVKQNSMATLVGIESGASYYSNGNPKQFLGTNTGVLYHISRTYYEVTANDFPKNRGILPDHSVNKTPRDIVENRDVQMKYALKLIKNE